MQKAPHHFCTVCLFQFDDTILKMYEWTLQFERPKSYEGFWFFQNFDFSKILIFPKFWFFQNFDFSKIFFPKFWFSQNFDFPKILIFPKF